MTSLVCNQAIVSIENMSWTHGQVSAHDGLRGATVDQADFKQWGNNMCVSKVLVVGAGPTGLTMALELARRGVEVRVIDRAPQPNVETRALGVQARTLELFERTGIARDLLTQGLKAKRFNVFSEGRQILTANFEHLPTAYPFLLMVPQNEVEGILTRHLAEYGVMVERERTLTDLTARPQKCIVKIEDSAGQVETGEYEWVIGADGAHSSVRKLLEIGFVGAAFDEAFAVADLRIDWERPADEFFAFLERGRFAAFFPMPGGWHRVAIAQPPWLQSGRSQSELRVDELQAAIDATVPGGPEIVEVRQAGRFRINQRRAAAHRINRVFLAGDAAHIHSVIGAQGMNTGIQDAFNLGWKLAEVIQGRADPELLDSYEAERSPVAARLVKATRRVTRLTLIGHPLGTAARRNIAPRFLGLSSTQRRLTRAISQLDLSYHDDSATSGSDQVRVGDRAPNASISTDGNEAMLHDQLHPTRFTLIAFGMERLPTNKAASENALASLIDEMPAGSAVARIPSETEAGRTYGIDGPTFVLVRPDGYVAARGSATDITNFIYLFRRQEQAETRKTSR